MAESEPLVAWILTLEYERRRLGQANYFYRFPMDHTKLVAILCTENFDVVPDCPYNEDVQVRVGLLRISRRSPNDDWSIGSDPHHYHLKGADLQGTIDALLHAQFQHTTRLTDAVEGALGERWDVWRL